ncbi:DUF3455 domain-containing protein [Bradyrhizobium roseum]|uniref:DUF3455 domain-containing protein n=1 Tax=Bradyrhizobium roseum TaxID=3056648 RepID=UPI0026045776|nr:DUF3455 domain-containing protein [Bradyrhizobium roseus]WKA32099.1 DUF3455 domain-containing protein [Bradyrhizobium roseus]
MTAVFLVGSLATAAAQTALPDAIAAPGETAILKLHAEGAQVYECKSTDGALSWTFREPIATLFQDGKTVGRHYAGPSWEVSDGSAVVAQVAGTSPGSVAMDIPWLKLTVTSKRGNGVLSAATTVQRINTVGGKLTGACYKAGAYESVPYAADYIFLKKG